MNETKFVGLRYQLNNHFNNQNLNTMNREQVKALFVAEQQEQILLRMRESIEQHNKSTDHSSTYQFERAKLIGMLCVLDALQVDRGTFNWIFN